MTVAVDKSRINDPSGKIANNQMIGFVYFEQTAGGNLKTQPAGGFAGKSGF